MTEQGRWQADAFCVAAGPWSAELLRGLGVSLAVEPRRGQMVAWQLVQPMFRHIVNEGPRYLLSRDDGWLLAGSTVEDVGFDDAPTEEGIAQLLLFARQWAIALRNRPPQQTWAGLRPGLAMEDRTWGDCPPGTTWSWQPDTSAPVLIWRRPPHKSWRNYWAARCLGLT